MTALVWRAASGAQVKPCYRSSMGRDNRIAVGVRITPAMLTAIDQIALDVSRPGIKMVSRHRMAARLLALGIKAAVRRGTRQVATRQVQLCTCMGAATCSVCPTPEELAKLSEADGPIELPEVGSGKGRRHRPDASTKDSA